MNILVFNCGSSSLKYKLISMPEEIELLSGEAQRIGPKTAIPSRIEHRQNGKVTLKTIEMNTHYDAFQNVLKIIDETSDYKIEVFGHRMVHGGDVFRKSIIINDRNLKKLELTKKLAPIHNPPIISLVQACKKLCPEIPQASIFDTAFHATIPDYAYFYAIPKKLQKDLKIRKYGFHGTSHQFVLKEASKRLNIPTDQLNAVSCHLGSGGASLCAIKNGKSIDNTMGYSPLQGLVMSTRSGDIDPSITLKLLVQNNAKTAEIEKLLNKKSGVLGLTNKSSDIRDNLPDKDVSFDKLNRASKIYVWRIKKYLGAYLTIASPVNTIIFTDTIGEEIPLVRKLVCENMEYFGIKIDNEKNFKMKNGMADISSVESKVKILVIRTNEELEIARNTYNLVKK